MHTILEIISLARPVLIAYPIIVFLFVLVYIICFDIKTEEQQHSC